MAVLIGRCPVKTYYDDVENLKYDKNNRCKYPLTCHLTGLTDYIDQVAIVHEEVQRIQRRFSPV